MSTMASDNEHDIIQAVEQWLDEVVIGLDLCPFAAKPRRKQQVRICVCKDESEQAILECLQAELTLIDERPVLEAAKAKANNSHFPGLETTLLVVPHLLADFDDYNQFLDVVDALLEQFDWLGDYQVASFHPQYCFAGVPADSAENLTNRSPYPLLHIIREASIASALAHYDNPELIPERNIERVCNLSEAEKRQLFAYLF
jgi:uncharacterized protein